MMGEEWVGSIGDCVNCSINFYKPEVGNSEKCRPCPDNSITTQNGSILCGELP